MNLTQRVLKMTVAEKIKLATLGNKGGPKHAGGGTPTGWW